MLARVAVLIVLLAAAACAAAGPQPGPVAAAAPQAAAPPAPQALLPGLAAARPVDEALRAEYARCDREDRFGAATFPIRNAAGRTVWFGCRTDPSRLERLLEIPATGDAPQAILFTSKLGLDLDGSFRACTMPGLTDQCPTSLMLPATASHPCPPKLAGTTPADRCVPVDSDRVPYVVLPLRGPPGMDAAAFRRATGIAIGDVGVVVFAGRTVPVIVADGGPAYKVGEGSMALHRALGVEFCRERNAAGECVGFRPATSIPGGVTTVLFPGSRRPGLSPDTLADVVRDRATTLHQALLAAHPGG